MRAGTKAAGLQCCPCEWDRHQGWAGERLLGPLITGCKPGDRAGGSEGPGDGCGWPRRGLSCEKNKGTAQESAGDGIINLFSFPPRSFLDFWGVLFIFCSLPLLFAFPEQQLEVGNPTVAHSSPDCMSSNLCLGFHQDPFDLQTD